MREVSPNQTAGFAIQPQDLQTFDPSQLATAHQVDRSAGSQITDLLALHDLPVKDPSADQLI